VQQKGLLNLFIVRFVNKANISRGSKPKPIATFYAGLLALLFILLSARVIGARRNGRVALGDGGDAKLLRRISVHANFAEYAPMSILLLALVESLAAPAILLHAAGIAMVFARAVHAYGVSTEPENFRFRVTGMVTTFTVLGVLAVACIALAAMRAI